MYDLIIIIIKLFSNLETQVDRSIHSGLLSLHYLHAHLSLLKCAVVCGYERESEAQERQRDEEGESQSK